MGKITVQIELPETLDNAVDISEVDERVRSLLEPLIDELYKKHVRYDKDDVMPVKVQLQG